MRRSVVNRFANVDTALGYEALYETTGRRADRPKKALLRRLLACSTQASSLLAIGCGTGHLTRWFEELGLQTAGLARSLPMLAEAIRLGSPPCMHSDALALPFFSDAFDLVVLIMALEFVANSCRLRDVSVERLSVEVAYEETPKPRRVGAMEVAIRIEPEPSEEVKQRLLGVARHATLINTLARPPEVEICFAET